MKIQNSKFKSLTINHQPSTIKKSIQDRAPAETILDRLTINYQPNLGFTLIELLVSLVIIILFVSVGFAGFSSLNQRQTLVTAGQTLKNILRDAQSRAYNREIDCTPGVCDCSTSSSQNFVGWYVDFPNKKIYGKCGTISFYEKNFDLPGEIVITPYITPPTLLLFKSSPPGTAQQATICLKSNNLSAEQLYSVQVSQTGVISDSGGIIALCP